MQQLQAESHNSRGTYKENSVAIPAHQHRTRTQKLEFPEPYKHEHPFVRNAIELFKEQLTFSQKAAELIAETVGS